MKPCITPRPFELGLVVATRNAHETLSMSDITAGLTRHAGNDWGDVCKSDWEANDIDDQDEGRLLSSYRSATRRTRPTEATLHSDFREFACHSVPTHH